MEERLFQMLKTSFASKGVSIYILKGVAKRLAKTTKKEMTDEELNSIIKEEEEFIMDMEKENNRRVTEAIRKAQNEAGEKRDLNRIILSLLLFMDVDLAETKKKRSRKS